MKTFVKTMITEQTISSVPECRAFLTYVRTLQLSGLRLRGREKKESVYIPHKEIEQRFFPHPKMDPRIAIPELVKQGELSIEEKVSEKGRKYKRYAVLKPGDVDFNLLSEPRPVKGNLYLKMIEYLQAVSYPEGKESTEYLECFLEHVKEHPLHFFKVDDFSGRVHTPITNLQSHLRANLKLCGSPTVSFDVATMQPMLLGKILEENIGNNEFSDWINSGVDIYKKLREIAKLPDRGVAKKRFFEILFSPPSAMLATMFGDASWINWVNDYKELYLPENPHNEEKPHSNLAWLLQRTEVVIMKNVWYLLYLAEIPFLTVHDEIIVRKQDATKTRKLFDAVLSEEFNSYRLN